MEPARQISINTLLMSRKTSRRHFLGYSAIAGAGFWISGCASSDHSSSPVAAFPPPRKISPNEKLNIAMVGTANQAGWNLSQVASQNIVALCDVDDKFLSAAAEKHPKARRYSDFRKMLEQDDIDAVVIATPDHIHAVATVAALQSGRH